MDYKGLIDGLKGLLNENTPVETAEQIGKLIAGAEQLESDNAKVVKSAEDLRQKYIAGLKNYGVSNNVDNPISEEKKPMTFEECVEDVIANRKK